MVRQLILFFAGLEITFRVPCSNLVPLFVLGLLALKFASGTFMLIRLSVEVVWLEFSGQGKLEPSCLVWWLLFCLYFVMFELICYYGCMVWLALLFGCGNVIVQGNSGEKHVFSPKRDL